MLCPGCGKSVLLQDGKLSLCDECRSNQPVHEVVDDTNSRPHLSTQEENISSLPVAGFWLRVAAYVIDLSLSYVFFIVFVFVIIFGVFSSLVLSSTFNFYLLIGGVVIYFVTAICILFLFPIIFEISSMQGTIGKYLVGIMIVNEDGSKMGILKTIGRSIVRSLSFVFLGIGFLFAASPPKKQAIHDMVFATKVVKFKEVPLKIIIAYLVPAVIVSMLIGYFSDNKKSKSAFKSSTINFEIPQATGVKNFDKLNDSLNEISKGLKELEHTTIQIDSSDVTKSDVVEANTSPHKMPSPLISPSPIATKKKKDLADLPEFERRRIQALMLRDGTTK